MLNNFILSILESINTLSHYQFPHNRSPARQRNSKSFKGKKVDFLPSKDVF